MKFILTALVALGSFSFYAQGHGFSTAGTPHASTPIDLSSSNTLAFGTKLQAARTQFETGIEGSPFLFEKSQDNFDITTTDFAKYRLTNLNYNLVSQKLISNLSKDSIFEFDKNKITSFVKNKRQFKFIDLDGVREIFESIYTSEDVVFYKKPASKIINEVINPLTKEVVKNRSYGIVEHYYLGANDTKISKIKLKKKDVLKVLNDKSSEIQDYVSQNKLDYDSEADLVKILKHYTTL
jgi:hypothetical protein